MPMQAAIPIEACYLSEWGCAEWGCAEAALFAHDPLPQQHLAY